jgi:uncharacterized protein YfiM (DUF2279 family)
LQTYTTSGNGPSTTSSSSGSTTEQAKDKAKEQAQQAAGQARGAVRGQVDQRSTEAGERVNSLASDVRSVGDGLREQGKDQPAKLADQAADRAERLGSYLRDSDADRILGDIEDFGRRQPWVIIAGGITLGVVASRFLKASSSSRYESRYQSRYESSGRLPARTSDVSPRSGLGGTDLGASDTGLGASGTGLGASGVGAGSDLGTSPPVRRDPPFDDPTLGDVVPPARPGSTTPGTRTDGGL